MDTLAHVVNIFIGGVLEQEKGLDTLQQGFNWNSFHCTHCNETSLHVQMHWQAGECDKTSVVIDNILAPKTCIHEQMWERERE